MKTLITLIALLLPMTVAATTLKTEHHVSLMNAVRTTTSTTYTFTADREPIWYYDADAFDQVTAVYFESDLKAGNAADTAYNALYTKAGSVVTSSEATTSATSITRVRSADIKANLVDDTEYRTYWKCDNGSGGAPAGTCSINASRVIIVQQGQVTKTETVIELSEDNNVPSTSYSAPTDYGIFLYESSAFDGTVTAYVEADMHENASGNTVRARLYDITAGSAVASSEVTDTGDTTTDRVRSSAITLTDGHSYRPDVSASSTSDDLSAFKLIVQQTGTPTKSRSYIGLLNSMSTGADTSYSNQARYINWDASAFDGDSEAFAYEATMLSTLLNPAYSQLYNVTDASQNASTTTSGSSYARIRTSGITMPSDDGNSLDHGRKVTVAGSATVARTFILVDQEWSTPASSAVPDEDIIWFE